MKRKNSIAEQVEQQIHRYGNGSCYQADGRFHLAFYYENLDGRKSRKVLSEPKKKGLEAENQHSKEDVEQELQERRYRFLYDLYSDLHSLEETPAPVPGVAPQADLAKQVEELARSIQHPKKQLKDGTVGDLVEEVLRVRKNDSRLGTSGWNDLRTRGNTINRYLGKKHFHELTHEDFQSMLTAYSTSRDTPYSETTLKNLASFFITVLTYAKKHRYLDANDWEDITSDIVIPKNCTRLDKGARFVDYPALGKALAVFHQSGTLKQPNMADNGTGVQYYYIMRVLFLTGLRPQELFALQKEDLIPEEHCLFIRNALKVQETGKGRRKFEIGDTKTRTSVRKVPAIPAVFTCLDRLEKLQVQHGARARSYETGCQNFVLVNKDGFPINLHTMAVNQKRYQTGRTAISPCMKCAMAL